MGEYMNSKPKLLYLLILLWIIFGIIFIYLGTSSLSIALYIISPESINQLNLEDSEWIQSLMFFGTFFLTTTMLVFGSIFVIFSYETYQRKTWVWNAGVIISTIFIVVFSFMLGSLMITSLMFMNQTIIQALIIIMIAFLTDLGIIFLITRPNIKAYFEK